MKGNRAQRTTNLSLALKGFWAKTFIKLHERCPLLQELNNQPSRLLLTLMGVVNEQLLPSRNLASAEDQEWTDDERASSCDLFDQGRLQDRHSTGRTAQSELNQRVDTKTPQKMGTWTSDGEVRDDQGQETEHEYDGFLDTTLPDNVWNTQDEADEAECSLSQPAGR